MKPSHVCQYLRTKKMFITEQPDAAFAQSEDEQGSPHCWCNRTSTEVGPDDRQVGVQVCNPSRPCYEE